MDTVRAAVISVVSSRDVGINEQSPSSFFCDLRRHGRSVSNIYFINLVQRKLLTTTLISGPVPSTGDACAYCDQGRDMAPRKRKLSYGWTAPVTARVRAKPWKGHSKPPWHKVGRATARHHVVTLRRCSSGIPNIGHGTVRPWSGVKYTCRHAGPLANFMCRAELGAGSPTGLTQTLLAQTPPTCQAPETPEPQTAERWHSLCGIVPNASMPCILPQRHDALRPLLLCNISTEPPAVYCITPSITASSAPKSQIVSSYISHPVVSVLGIR